MSGFVYAERGWVGDAHDYRELWGRWHSCCEQRLEGGVGVWRFDFDWGELYAGERAGGSGVVVCGDGDRYGVGFSDGSDGEGFVREQWVGVLWG